MTGTTDTTATASFDPRRLEARTPKDAPCTYTRSSVTDAQWNSVLLRIGHRNDAAGIADLGVSEHPRIILTTQGSIAVSQHRDGRQVATRLAPGRAWLIPPHAQLRYDWTQGGASRRELAALTMAKHDLREAATALADARAGHYDRWDRVIQTDDVVINAVLTGMSSALSRGADDLYAQSASAFLLQHVLLRYGSTGLAPERVGHEDRRVRSAIELIRAEPGQALTLADMAAAAGLSKYHFLRVFRAATGETPGAFLRRHRLDLARRHLSEQHLSITDIAGACGFGSSSQFASAFRRDTGMSPRAYRRASGSR